MNLQLIRQYAEHYPGGMRKLAADAGMSEGNLHRCIRNNKIQATDLEALSQRLGVRIEIFFTDDSNAVRTHDVKRDGLYLWLLEKVKLLEQLIKDKETIISEKERLIKILSR